MSDCTAEFLRNANVPRSITRDLIQLVVERYILLLFLMFVIILIFFFRLFKTDAMIYY